MTSSCHPPSLSWLCWLLLKFRGAPLLRLVYQLPADLVQNQCPPPTQHCLKPQVPAPCQAGLS